MSPIHGTVAIVKQLKERGIRLYFLSDGVKERAEYLQRTYNFLHYFVSGIFSYEVHRTKSDGPAVFLLALEKTGAAPAQVVYIDDREEYAEQARQLGMHVICFKNSEQLAEELQKLGL